LKYSSIAAIVGQGYIIIQTEDLVTQLLIEQSENNLRLGDAIVVHVYEAYNH